MVRYRGSSWLVLLLVLALTLTLVVGCGQQQAPAPKPDEKQAEQPPADEKFPSRTIEIMNQFGPGGGTDIFIRGIGVPASRIAKQSIIPISVTGGGGVAATERFLSEPADGYTLRAIGPEQVVNHLMGREDLSQMVPIIRCQFDQSTFAVKKDSQFADIKAVVDYAKANPGKLTIGGTDAAGFDEVIVNLWANEAGVNVKYVPFASASEANAALLGGHIDVLHEEVGPLKALLDGDKVRLLVIFMEKRTDLYPNVPTSVELGWNVTIGRWRGFAGKVGTPADRIQYLYELFAKAMEDKIYKVMEEENLLFLRPGLLGPDEFKAFLDEELEVYGKVLKDLGMIK